LDDKRDDPRSVVQHELAQGSLPNEAVIVTRVGACKDDAHIVAEVPLESLKRFRRVDAIRDHNRSVGNQQRADSGPTEPAENKAVKMQLAGRRNDRERFIDRREQRPRECATKSLASA
jgi:hypothetical protein